jgi:hypothetical protein
MGLLKIMVVAVVCWAFYVFAGGFPQAHSFAFGIGGMGVSYLMIGLLLAGLITYKIVA